MKEKAKQVLDSKALIEKAGKIAEEKLGSAVGQKVKDFLISKGIQEQVDAAVEKGLQMISENTEA